MWETGLEQGSGIGAGLEQGCRGGPGSGWAGAPVPELNGLLGFLLPGQPLRGNQEPWGDGVGGA